MDWKNIHTGEQLDEELDKKIQETRTHDFRLLILDAEGKPCPDVRVKAVHKDHDFIFGVCPNGHISMTNRLACGEGQEAELYWEYIGKLFNATTLWWGWRVLEPEKGCYTYEEEIAGFGPMEKMVQRAERLGHRLTAHAVLYPRADVSPKWLSDCTEEEALNRLEEHIKELGKRYADRIACWHPVNEAYDEILQVGGLELNEGLVYKWVSENMPGSCLVDNGGNTIAPDFYEKGIKNAQRFGSRVDELGIRGYFELYDAEALPFYESIWEHFSNLTLRYGKKLRFTEIGAVSAPRKGEYSTWDVDPTTAGQLGITNSEAFREEQPITEETQAVFLSRMYKLAFAHPEVKECTYWDLCDSYTWNQVEGGLLRPDLSPKPAYEALHELIKKQWKTEVSVTTDEDGSCGFHGFDGTYEVEADGETYSVHWNREEKVQVVCIKTVL